MNTKGQGGGGGGDGGRGGRGDWQGGKSYPKSTSSTSRT